MAGFRLYCKFNSMELMPLTTRTSLPEAQSQNTTPSYHASIQPISPSLRLPASPLSHEGKFLPHFARRKTHPASQGSPLSLSNLTLSSTDLPQISPSLPQTRASGATPTKTRAIDEDKDEDDDITN
ncbi:hypothetical protein Dimus_023388 [Dionaea muscipula]